MKLKVIIKVFKYIIYKKKNIINKAINMFMNYIHILYV